MTKKKYTSEMESGALTPDLRQAVADIKTAILQGQYEAAKGTNRIQLAVYFGIGKYVSQHSRKGTWGTSALDTISSQLRRELPGLRGYSATALRNMRKFYENWMVLDASSSVATDDSDNSASAIAELEKTDNQSVIISASALAEIPSAIADEFRAIDIYHTMQIPLTKDFPIEDFFVVLKDGLNLLEIIIYFIKFESPR